MAQLNKAPNYILVRSAAGPIAADNAVIDFTNYPLALAFDPYSSKAVQLWWEATAGEVDADALTLELLELHGKTGAQRWIRGAQVAGVRPGRIVVLPAYGNNKVAVRVVSAPVTLAEGLQIWAAMADHV